MYYNIFFGDLSHLRWQICKKKKEQRKSGRGQMLFHSTVEDLNVLLVPDIKFY